MTTHQWARARFQADFNDSRPIKWPPPGPTWETGLAGDESYATRVAYFPRDQMGLLFEYWPEAKNIEWQFLEEITFTDRFQCPDWWDEEKNKPIEEE